VGERLVEGPPKREVGEVEWEGVQGEVVGISKGERSDRRREEWSDGEVEAITKFE
jgi:hypothetical protein